MGMLFAGAWAGEQLLVVSGTEVIIGEDPIEGQSWLMGVVLLVTVGVVLLSCVCLLYLIRICQLESVHVTREPAIANQWSMSPRAMQDDDLDHLNTTESTWILSWYSGNHLRQLMVSNTRSLLGKLVQKRNS